MSAPASERNASRNAARLAAVQALYQMDVGGRTVDDVVDDLRAGRLPADEGGALDADVDHALFNQIIDIAVERQGDVDTMLAQRLASGWKLERIDSVARAILRAGLIELWRRKDVPTAVIVSEYVEIARAFFGDGAEPGFVNATLDACARALRAAPGGA